MPLSSPSPLSQRSNTDRRPRRRAVLHLGTPDEPTPAAVRRYLAEFLSDARVVEIPKLLWLLDSARHHFAHTSGPIRRQIRQHLDTRRLAPEAVDREAGQLLQGGWASADTASWCATPCATQPVHRLATGRAQGRRRHPRADPAAYPQYSATSTASVLTRSMPGLPKHGSSRTALRESLPRSSGLHPGTCEQHPALLAAARTAQQTADELSRRARAHAATGRSYHCECRKPRACWPKNCT